MKSTFLAGAVQEIVLPEDAGDTSPPIWRVRSLSYGQHVEFETRFETLTDEMPEASAKPSEWRAWTRAHRDACMEFVNAAVVGAKNLPEAIDGLTFPLDDTGRSVLTRTKLVDAADRTKTTSLLYALTRAARNAQVLDLSERRALPGPGVDAGG